MRNTNRNRPKSTTRQAMPIARVTNAEQGGMKITVSQKVKKGIYELVLQGNDGQEMFITKLEVA